jgi:hypothetical protein
VMQEAQEHGLAFFVGEGAFAHQGDNQFVQDVAWFLDGWAVASAIVVVLRAGGLCSLAD